MQLNVTFSYGAIEMVIVILLFLAIIFLLIYHRFPIHLIYKSKIGLESMLDAMNEPLAVISRDYTIKRVNKAYTVMTGHPYTASINAKCYKILRDRSSPCDNCRLKDASQDAASQITEISTHPRGVGSVSITISPYAMPIKGKTTEICFIEHIRDITAIEKLKNDLEQRNKYLAALTAKLQAAQRSIKADLLVAHQIQEGLLPQKISQINKLRFDMTYKSITDVGGDIYDFISFDNERVGVFIGDASGHGLASSLIGTLSKMSLYNHSRANLSTSELLDRMNRDLKAHIHTSHYITCFWSVFDFNKNIMTYSRAGHPIQILLRKDGTLQGLAGSGIFLGITEDAVYEEKTLSFETGDRFYWFTDGIYDVFRKARKSEKEMDDFLGYNKFMEFVRQTANTPFDKIIETLKSNLAEYKFEDDYTLIIAEIC